MSSLVIAPVGPSSTSVIAVAQALDRPAQDFLAITYPSVDLLKTLQAVQPDATRPVVIIGSRGQGKSHLMAALTHMLRDAQAGTGWLAQWASSAHNSAIGDLKLRTGMHVVAESLHLHNYKFLWIWPRSPSPGLRPRRLGGGGRTRRRSLATPSSSTCSKKQPMALILDEFQTWYDGLTNTKQYPWRTWAFNFIQILSEIAQHHPERLIMVVSVRDGTTEAAQQMYRVDPVRVDFRAAGQAGSPSPVALPHVSEPAPGAAG